MWEIKLINGRFAVIAHAVKKYRPLNAGEVERARRLHIWEKGMPVFGEITVAEFRTLAEARGFIEAAQARGINSRSFVNGEQAWIKS